jgi:hypothetical protein
MRNLVPVAVLYGAEELEEVIPSFILVHTEPPTRVFGLPLFGDIVDHVAP